MDARAREFVRQRAQRRCEYCRLPEAFDEWPFHLEHIIAVQHGGDDSPSNLGWACSRCNLHKGTNLISIDPETNQQTGLFNPRQQQWSDHFTIHEARILGITAVGRATLRLLRMNDARRVELRRELIEQQLF